MTLDHTSVTSLSRAIEDIRFTGGLIVKTPQPERMAKRDSFANTFREFLRAHAPRLIPVLDKQVKYASDAETGYHAILLSLGKQDLSSQDSAVQLWSAIEFACISIEHLLDDVRKSISERKRGELRLPLTTVQDRRGREQNVDSLFAVFATVLHSTLLMLAWRHGWFVDKALVIPPPPPSSDIDPRQSAPNTYLASAWMQYEEADEYIRLFGGTLSCAEEVVTDGDRDEELLICRFECPIYRRVFETIARERIDALMLDWYVDLDGESDAELSIYSAVDAIVPMSPMAYVSRDEYLAERVLAGVYHIDVNSPVHVIACLNMRQLIRGYACLKRLANEDQPVRFKRLSRKALESIFSRAGLDSVETEAFIEVSSLSKGKRDLYDAPIIRDTSGEFWFFAPLIQSANLVHIIVSQAVALEAQLDSKGQIAEVALRQIFQAAGLPVAEITYEEDGQQYQCDAAVLWEEHLFVFELKNRLIPLGMSSEYSWHFWEKLREDSKQCERIAKQLLKRPDLIQEKFGAQAVVAVAHPILLQALPFSLPSAPFGAHIYDMSALGRFFTDPLLRIAELVPREHAGMSQIHHVVGSLWAGNQPVPEDLIKEIANPIQVRVSKGKWSSSREEMRLSEKVGAVVPIPRRKPDEPSDFLRALGWNEDQIVRFNQMMNTVSDKLVPIMSVRSKRRRKRKR